MDKIDELKEIIRNLKMEVVRTRVYKGSCPYSFYAPLDGKEFHCMLDCENCRNLFFIQMEEKIRKEVEEL